MPTSCGPRPAQTSKWPANTSPMATSARARRLEEATQARCEALRAATTARRELLHATERRLGERLRDTERAIGALCAHADLMSRSQQLELLVTTTRADTSIDPDASTDTDWAELLADHPPTDAAPDAHHDPSPS